MEGCGVEPSPLGVLEVSTEPGPVRDAAVEPGCYRPAPRWGGQRGSSWCGADQAGGMPLAAQVSSDSCLRCSSWVWPGGSAAVWFGGFVLR